MRFRVVAIRAGGGVQALSTNDIAVAFDPGDQLLALGDELEINLLQLDEEQLVRRLADGVDLRITIRRHDVHDLRIPNSHGSSRFPSRNRLLGA